MPPTDPDQDREAPGTAAEESLGHMLDLGRELFARTGSREAVLCLLSSSGLSIIDAIKAVREICSVGLQDAKASCVGSGLWRDQVDASEPLHEDLERMFRGGCG